MTIQEINTCMQRVNGAMQVINQIQSENQLGFLYEIDATFITGREYMSTDRSTHRRIGQYSFIHGASDRKAEQSLLPTSERCLQ